MQSTLDPAMKIPVAYNDAVVRRFAIMTVIWGIVGMLVGVWIAAELIWPNLNFGLAFLSYGRLRPLHTNAVIFAFGGSALFASSYLWSHMAPLARLIPPRGVAGSLLLGMLWGWLPCGFIYSMLIFAALKGGALQAAAMMLFFGLGTAPAVFGAGMLSAQFGRFSVARGLHTVAGWLLLAFGALTIYGPLNPAHH
jgi:sulfite exporter TauE/SafE